MKRSILWTSILGLAACATTTTPGSRPHEMSAAHHDQEAALHSSTAELHAAQYDPSATATRERCRARSGAGARADANFAEYSDVCWTSVTNPTEVHLRHAEEHRRHAADHRAGSDALRDAEARACAGINPNDRDTSPFDHVEDITNVEPLVDRTGAAKAPSERVAGAIVTFRAVPGMTEEKLQRIVDCHLARNASLGHAVPEMPSCPLVPVGARTQVRSVGEGFAVEIRSDQPNSAREILARSERLQRGVAAAPSEDRAGHHPTEGIQSR